MKLKWLGHSCFLITSETGLKIITDPYGTVQGVNYEPVKETADIVTVSHDHFDHNAVSSVAGKPELVKNIGAKNVKGIQFKGIATYHDEAGGKQRGANTILCFSVDGIKICHLGDLGHPLNSGQLKEIGDVDLLLIPVGGYFTIDARVATQICNDLKPRVIVPMHYKTAKLDFPVAGVDDFLKGKGNVKRLDRNEIELKAETLPGESEILVLKPAS
jgi:L-ascorbate metabolism protein UlaG (beta-lactamase superfamily)